MRIWFPDVTRLEALRRLLADQPKPQPKPVVHRNLILVRGARQTELVRRSA